MSARSGHEGRYLLDKPLYHKDLKWKWRCGICLQPGHHFMECGKKGHLPAKVRRAGESKDILPFCTLYEEDAVDKYGRKKS